MTPNLPRPNTLLFIPSIAMFVNRLAIATGVLAATMGLSVLAPSANAQVKPGFGVYANLSLPGTTNVGGLTIFDPLNGISPCPGRPRFARVGGAMPQALLSAGVTGGANCVLVRDSDGSIVVSHIASGRMVSIYHLTLSGNSVLRSRQYPLAIGSSVGGVHQMAWYSDTQIAFAYKGLNSPFPAQGVALLDLVTGAIKRISIAPFPSGSLNAFALNRDRTTAYIGFYGPNGVYSVPFPGGGTPRKVGPSLLKGPYQLDVDDAGNVYQSTFTLGMFVYRGGVWVRLDSTPQMNAMSIERVSGDVLFADLTTVTPARMFRWSSTGGRVLLPGMPAKDSPVGIAVRSSLIPSGSPAGIGIYDWQIAPNPGGTPMVGNTKFSLSVATPVAPTSSLIALAPALALAPVALPFGAELLLGSPIISASMNQAGAGTSASVPIPNQVTLCGVTVYVQSFHLLSTGLASSSALSITLQ